MSEDRPRPLELIAKKRAEIQAQREKLQADLKRLEIGERDLEVTERTLRSLLGPNGHEAGGPLTNLKIVEAAEKVLRELGPPPIHTNRLIDEMQARGFRSQAKNVYASVFSTLSRAAKKADGNLEMAGDSNWALREWGADSQRRNG